MTYRTKAAAAIRGRIEALANEVTDRQFRKHPELATRFGPLGRARCVDDARFHWSFLAAAVDTNIDAIFVDYVAWAKTVLTTRKISHEDLHGVLTIMADVLRSSFDAALASAAIAPVEQALEQIKDMPLSVTSLLDTTTDRGAVAKQYLEALLTMHSRAAIRVVASALEQGLTTQTICCDVLEPVQREIGRLWQMNEISVAMEHFASGVTQQLLAQIGSFRRANIEPQRKRAVLLCAPGEFHDIGIRAIAELLSLDGWHTLPLGANVPAAAAVRVCVDWKPDVILISASLPPHIAAVCEVVQLLRAEPALENARVLVGGRIFTQYPEMWRVTGADGSAADAAGVIALLGVEGE